MAEIYRLDRALLEVAGPNATAFLDNLLTQNVARLNDAGILYAALLSPQGKVSTDMLLWRHSDRVIIETDPTMAADLFRKLSMYKLRAPVSLNELSGQHVRWSAENFPGAASDPRLPAGALGWRSIAAGAGEAPDGAAVFDARRLELGVPDLARDAAPEEVFALEALLEELNGVDFGKGCFVGQENVSRMKRRATTRRKFCPLAFEGPALPPGTAVTAGDVELGTVRTGAAGRSIALLRLDRALEAVESGKQLAAGGRSVRLDPPPWLILPQSG